MTHNFKVGDRIRLVKFPPDGSKYYEGFKLTIGARGIVAQISDTVYYQIADMNNNMIIDGGRLTGKDDEWVLDDGLNCKYSCKGCIGKCDLWEKWK